MLSAFGTGAGGGGLRLCRPLQSVPFDWARRKVCPSTCPTSAHKDGAMRQAELQLTYPDWRLRKLLLDGGRSATSTAQQQPTRVASTTSPHNKLRSR